MSQTMMTKASSAHASSAQASPIRIHAAPVQIRSSRWHELPHADAAVGSEQFVSAAGHAGALLPGDVQDALVGLTDEAPRAGALLLRGLPVGDLPATPARPGTVTKPDTISELVLLTVARRLGEPVGYEPEHRGDLIQNIVPTRSAAGRQTSTSSKVELMFHTEAAFHPYRPRYLLLLCLRGDPLAETTLASIHEVLPLLTADVIETLFEERFRTAVDESYLHGRGNVLGPPMAVLTGRRDRPSMVFDADLMVGTDPAADAAIRALSHAVAEHHTAVVLEPGDLLVVDNTVAVHGRSPFTPRFDGTDRWLQRTFVVSDLAASAADRRGRVITTRFGG
ncbi:MAG: L-lysine 3-hydroxylase [Ilumatobacteraceae bacterium]|nr:L-lysine 3-hydroxylase [Ilumatobacteraceae bacterium]